MFKFDFATLRGDIYGGVTTAVVAVDTSVALSVEELLEQTTAAGVACFIAGVSSPAARTLGQLNVLDRVPSSRRFERRIDAIRAAAGEVERQKTREAAVSSGYDRPAPAS